MRIAFLGAGKIAHTVARTLTQVPSLKLYAVAARDKNRAEAFASQYGFTKAYGSYEEMLADPQVELVYISTVNNLHFEHMTLCIRAKKPVLCEKPFTSTAREAREVLAMAAREKVFVGEAIWPRYVPLADTIVQLVNSGRLGEIVSLQANLGYPVSRVPRLDRLDLSGGALLDIGVYTLTFASLCFGDEVAGFDSTVRKSPSGVDQQSMVQLCYANGRRAYLLSSSLTATDRTGVIYGSQGYAVVHNINNYQGVDIYNAGNELVQQIKAPPQISGYEYQFLACAEAVRKGELEPAQMPHQTTIRIMDLMDSIRHSWSLYYPGEEAGK
ncbi:MAG: Gfo/Idh/MocA family oxidoreductase [Clostridiales bacterium]|nr:Gfo/Idh/MocA family oxidoreductase [Clostridiales bacterium]